MLTVYIHYLRYGYDTASKKHSWVQPGKFFILGHNKISSQNTQCKNVRKSGKSKKSAKTILGKKSAKLPEPTRAAKCPASISYAFL